MQGLTRALLQYRTIVLILFLVALAAGGFAFSQLDIEAYPDPSPPMVEFITQNPAWSAEEMEQQVTIPVETVLNGTPKLTEIRSISIFGLSDVKLYFDFNSSYFVDRQEALNRLQSLTLPNSLQPQLSPESPVGEIYRYQLIGPGYSLNELKAEQDWFVVRQIKSVPGIIDVATFGGTTRQYQAEIDPNRLLAMGVTMTQVVTAIQNSNANAGGNYLTMGSQSVNVRGIGLLKSLADMNNIVVAEHNGTPILLRDVATVKESHQPRLGKVGFNENPDIVEGLVLLQKGEQSLPALKALSRKINELNSGNLLPPGMQIKTIYNRSRLVNRTTDTVQHIVLMGMILVTIVLYVTLGDVRITTIAALTIPFALLFAFSLMVLEGSSANLLSIGAIDFGILVDASIIILENVYRKLSRRRQGETLSDVIVAGVSDGSRPVIFATLIILVSFIPLFTMQGVPGKIFAPMSQAYGFALIGALLYAFLFAPVLCFLSSPKHVSGKQTWLIANVGRLYEKTLQVALKSSLLVWLVAAVLLAGAAFAFTQIGGEFMPALEEGNLWIRATMQQDMAFPQSAELADQFRSVLRSFPEVTQCLSQMGRPDDGTDVSTFNNIELLADLKPANEWRPQFHGKKEELIAAIQKKFDHYPGIDFNFSQNIQDNVEEAMSGVKGENSLKLFGDDFDTLTSTADKIYQHMTHVRGVTDVGVFNVGGQPSLLISIDRAEAARYGIAAADINNAVQAAVGGAAVTQIIEGERRFDFAVRFTPQFRDTPEAIRKILLPTPDGNQIPLGNVANVTLHNGAFMIYREGGRRYIPIKFSVRGRDLQSTIEELKDVLAHQVKLPSGYTYTWAGEYDSLQKELHRLAFIVPISLLIVLLLLYLLFQSFRDALIVLATLPFGAIGGIFTLVLTHTSFSISAAVGFTSLLGLNTLCTVVFLTGLRHQQHDHGRERGVFLGAIDEMRPIVMACMAAGLGLLPAAIASGIGSQTQKPLARVVVGGTVTTVFAVLFLVPLMARMWAPVDRNPDRGGDDENGGENPPDDNGPPSPLELGRLLLAQHFQRPLPKDADTGQPPGKDG
ncbi:MAG: heavy metal efflux system protein [Acidobacteriaceae bacterium]|nr:heavy metal efflux system protein [Acidobacteriaceae bacterium]